MPVDSGPMGSRKMGPVYVRHFGWDDERWDDDLGPWDELPPGGDADEPGGSHVREPIRPLPSADDDSIALTPPAA